MEYRVFEGKMGIVILVYLHLWGPLAKSGVSCNSFIFESHCVIGGFNENKWDVKFESLFNENLIQAKTFPNCFYWLIKFN